VTDAPEHPLDPLTAEQIRQVAAIVRRDREIGESWRFASIELKEPAKDVLAALEGGLTAAARRSWWAGTGPTGSLAGGGVADRGRGHQLGAPARPAAEHDVDEWHECDQLLRGTRP